MKLSIITINKDNKEGLHKTITSVINQSLKEFEYIIVDGKSTDGSVMLLQEFDKYIDCWISEEDSGVYNAMNKGINLSNGDFLIFLNSGDFFINDKVLASVFLNNNFLYRYDYIFCNTLIVNKRINYIKKNKKELSLLHFFYDGVCHQSTFIKRKVLEEQGGYDESLQIMSDWKSFLLGIFIEKRPYIVIKHTIVAYNMFGVSSYNESRKLILEERKKVFQEYFPSQHEELEALYKAYKQTLRGIFNILTYKVRNFANNFMHE